MTQVLRGSDRSPAAKRAQIVYGKRMHGASPKRRLTLALLHNFFPVDWSMRRRYRLPTNDLAQPYYIYYPGTLQPDMPWNGISFDAHGVAMTERGYNAVTAAQYALYSHERLLRDVPGSRAAFFAQIRFLLERRRGDGGYPYDFAMPEYGVEPGFLSAMAQGLAASAFLRAHAVTGEARFREAAVLALEPLRRDTSQGGVSYLRGERAFFEEVASREPCHILNGHLFAAFGLWDAIAHGCADGELLALHGRAVETLRAWLPLFEKGGWSYYQLGVRDAGRRHYANIYYHHLHIAQLHVYAAMTGITHFAQIAARWERGLRDYRVRGRFWLDSASWSLDVVRRRVGRRRRAPWRPMQLVSETR